MQFIDSHAHLDDRRFNQDRDQVIARAAQVGVEHIITIGADLESSQAAIDLARQHPGVYATVGVHPHTARTVDAHTLAALRALCRDWAPPAIVAVGEVGLDFYRDLSPRDAQRRAFRQQLELADQMDLPVVIHDRDAHQEVLDTLTEWVRQRASHRLPGVIHCFSGDADLALQFVALGFYIGIDGPVTYPNAHQLFNVARAVPLDHLLIETDCPYLTPQRHRGQRNEPAYVRLVADRIAELRDLPLADVARMTTENARRLFGLPTESAN
ncbi:MAG: TatD family hydrolase [Chloroflexi bacterium]|nr:TatD family hydrolase [Chloroflexota bacterium]MBU1746480.1 TatD family hydrolase [Chloroflexota bacterium]